MKKLEYIPQVSKPWRTAEEQEEPRDYILEACQTILFVCVGVCIGITVSLLGLM